MQLAFDMDYTDPHTKELVPWALPTKQLLQEIEQSPFKIIDTETTGLNPASKPVNVTGKDLRRGVDPTVRLRIVTVLYWHNYEFKCEAFDFDQLTEEERVLVSKNAYKDMVIAHNAGFDAYWVRLRTKVRAKYLLDTMLLSRALVPHHPLVMASFCGNEEIDPVLRRHAEGMFTEGRSGWSLSDLVAGLFRVVIPKGMQKPRNWCEPFLSQEAYKYATDDTWWVLRILLKLFKLSEEEVKKDPFLLIRCYEKLLAENKIIKLIDPQVADVVEMREHGMPWDPDEAKKYYESQKGLVGALAVKMGELDSSLINFIPQMAEMGEGISASLKDAIGNSFIKVGLPIEVTDKAGTFKIGEKDLRRIKATADPRSKELFETWVKLNKAKKAASMSQDFTGFEQRAGGKKRIHPNTGHGPQTGRLASSEPNCQQAPRDQGFRANVKARKGHKISAIDFSALDMRVGAALAIRAQRQMFEAYMGDRKVDADVLSCIQRVYERKLTLDKAREIEKKHADDFEAYKKKRDEEGIDRSKYWELYRKKARNVLLSSFQRCLQEVKEKADAAGTTDWGSLRDAFNIKGMDIHTWTALGMIGKDPKAIFGGLSNEDVAKQLKKEKAALGDVRQTGKVGNLSLLYAMKTAGLIEAAAKNYDIHWDFETADKIRKDWLAAYVEVDLWHKWTELNPYTSVFVPDSEYGGSKFTKKAVFASYTLAERLIFAFGLNAGLSYEDQSTGADIMGVAMDRFRNEYPEIFECIVNQVHDELIFEFPDDKAQEWTDISARVLVESAEVFLGPYGVKAEVGPAVADFWVKD